MYTYRMRRYIDVRFLNNWGLAPISTNHRSETSPTHPVACTVSQNRFRTTAKSKPVGWNLRTVAKVHIAFVDLWGSAHHQQFQFKKGGPAPIHTIPYHCVHCIALQYSTVHCIALRYITIHYITVLYSHITLHTLHYPTLRYATLGYITLHYIKLHCIALHYITLHYISFTCHVYTLYI